MNIYNIYKGIKYYKEWNGNWFLILPELGKKIQMQEPFTDDDMKKIIENEYFQFI